MRIVDLIGPMLGADHLLVEGVALHTTDSDQVEHRFWSRHEEFRVERSDNLTHVHGRDAGGSPASVTIAQGRVLERGPRASPSALGVARLLLPRFALIWGRPGEEWRLSEELGAGRTPAFVRVELLPTEPRRDEATAHIEVEIATGRLWVLDLPGNRWTLERVEDSHGDPNELFAVE